MLVIFGPVLAGGALGALLALGAANAGWHTELMHTLAIGLAAALLVLAVALFYLQTGQRRALDLALHSVEARVVSVVDSAMDAIITVDENQCVVLYNVAAEK